MYYPTLDEIKSHAYLIIQWEHTAYPELDISIQSQLERYTFDYDEDIQTKAEELLVTHFLNSVYPWQWVYHDWLYKIVWMEEGMDYHIDIADGLYTITCTWLQFWFTSLSELFEQLREFYEIDNELPY